MSIYANPPNIRVYEDMTEKTAAKYERETVYDRVRQFFRQFPDSRELLYERLFQQGIVWERKERKGADMTNAQRALTDYIIAGNAFSFEGVTVCKFPWREPKTA